MTKIINSADQNFENDFNNLLTMNRSSDSDVTQTVAAIIDDIRKNGDEALLKYTHQFDKNSLDINNILLEEDEIESKFGFLMKALSYGAPPHGGIALGFDRIMMFLLNTESIRDVIAFPKTQRASCLMTEAPSNVSEDQLEELQLRIRASAAKQN